MRLSFNNIINEWFAVRHGRFIIAHSPELDECIALALAFIQEENKMKKLFVA